MNTMQVTTSPHRRLAAAARATCVLLLAAVLPVFAATPVVTNVMATQSDPLHPVDIYYDLLDADGDTCDVSIVISTNSGLTYGFHAVHLSGDVGSDICTGTQRHAQWDVHKDMGKRQFCTTMRVRITATDTPYLAIDVSGGPLATNYPVIRLKSRPSLDDGYRTSKILLRRIPAGSFVMGSPDNELGRDNDESPHTVTLPSKFYMGVLEITQGQYSNVMGHNPAWFPQGVRAMERPLEYVSWHTARGGIWPGSPPGSGMPTNTSFIGVLRAKTGLPFDLPTEAQWEYACRAGSTNAWNNGAAIANVEQDATMDMLGRYWYNGGYAYPTNLAAGAHTVVGSYLANGWKLHDTHGNVWEWCLDWYGAYEGDSTDPAGPISGTHRIGRGGCWDSSAMYCRSSYRGVLEPVVEDIGLGIRLSLTAEP